MMKKKRLAIIHTHPVQYNVPWFIKLSEIFDVKVFYTWAPTHEGYWDKKFKRHIRWDIPLTRGYDHEFVHNISPRPGPNTLWGTINPGLIRTLLHFEPDYILIYGWKNLSHLHAMTYFHGRVPVLFRGDSTMLDTSPSPAGRLRSTLLRQVYKNVDYALYVGTENKKYFLSHGLPSGRLIFVPHAVNNDFFRDSDGRYERQAQQWRARLGLDEGNLTFVYAGKFEPKKNLTLLMRAFLDDPHAGHRLLLVGGGAEEERLRAMAQADKRIIFLPFQNQSQMPVVYRLGHVLILPSAWGETWGLAVNEAMACGRAVMTSNKTGCAADLVRQGQNGYIFDFRDHKQLSSLMQSMTIKKAQKMGQASLEIIKNWTYEAGIINLKKALNL